MNLENVVIARAELGDAEGIIALAEKNAPGRGGELSVLLRRDDVEGLVTRGLPQVVARKNGAVIGFLLAREKSGWGPPVVRAMLEVYPGASDAYSYGPVCVEESARGLGLAGAMFEELKRLVPGREGILFIKASNEASLRAHRKMGMREVGEFCFEGTRLAIFAYGTSTLKIREKRLNRNG